MSPEPDVFADAPRYPLRGEGPLRRIGRRSAHVPRLTVLAVLVVPGLVVAGYLVSFCFYVAVTRPFGAVYGEVTG